MIIVSFVSDIISYFCHINKTRILQNKNRMKTMEVKQFKSGVWTEKVNVRDFVINNITPYHGTHDFLVGPSARTEKLWDICKEATQEERQRRIDEVHHIPQLYHT